MKLAFDKAVKILSDAVSSGQIKAASMVVRQGSDRAEQAFGTATLNSAFLLGSITKPIALAAVMHLYEQKKFSLDEPAQKYLPEFTGDERGSITVRHLMTHVLVCRINCRRTGDCDANMHR